MSKKIRVFNLEIDDSDDKNMRLLFPWKQEAPWEHE